MGWQTGPNQLAQGDLKTPSPQAIPAGTSAVEGSVPDPAQNPSSGAGEPSMVLKRRLYFLSGFDPRGASFYWRLFSQEVARRNTKSATPPGQSFKLVRRKQERDRLLSRWRLEPTQVPSPGPSTSPAQPGEGPSLIDQESLGPDGIDQNRAIPDPTSHELVFLHWDDIARNHWPRRSLGLIWEMATMYRWYVLEGGLWRIGRLCPGVALCGAYPGIFTGLALLIAVGSGASVGLLAQAVLPFAGLALGAAVLLAMGTSWLLLLGAWGLADRLGVVWLWRSIRFTHRLGQARDGDLRSRVGELASQILALETEAPAEAVLLVGHSSGSFVMAMLAAELRRQDRDGAVTGRLSLLSLGQNLANLAVYPGAQAFHGDLRQLAREPRLPWRDVTSRDDLLCFAGVDPYRSCGLPSPAGGPYPDLQLVPLAKPRGWLGRLKLAFQQFDLHFHYLRQAPASHGFDPISQLLKP